VEPVVPAGTPFDFVPVEIPERPEGAEEVKSESRVGDDARAPASGPERFPAAALSPEIGSNNWAVSGKLTASGYPILCNDMHLPLNLPAIWYEIQLNAPGVNTYGSTFPGVPTVVAGFNERASWGFTNGGSDVLDWYSVSFKDDSRMEYLYDGEWRETSLREEIIEVRGGEAVIENVIYTHLGPVVRLAGEPPFDEMNVPADAALRWLGHDPSNEFLTFHILNRAQNYDDFLEAVRSWSCPAQNIVYADVGGNIALAHSGLFPLRWKGQGRYLLDASNPDDEWQGWVLKEHIPLAKNPERGFVSSANQIYAGPDYPYYLGWNYNSFERGARINEILRNSESVTPEDMIRMQGDVVSPRARAVLPLLLVLIQENLETDAEKRVYNELERWNFEYKAGLIAPTIFNRVWRALDKGIWADEMRSGTEGMPYPASQITIDFILNHPDSEFFDDKTTPEKESLSDIAITAYRTAVRSLEDRLGPPGESWEWGKVKSVAISHLGRIPGFGREKLITDGDGGVINAISTSLGPSWRMVVSLEPGIRAWGIYPGGQSGNPGSDHYDDFIEDWAAGKPYELLFLRSPDEDHSEIVRKTTLRGAR
jgi:penicillin amidase